MPRIPIYQQQTTAGGAIPQSFDVGPRGEGLAALGDGLQHVSRVLERQQEADFQKFEADAVSSAHLAATKAAAEWETHLLERSQQAKDGAQGFTPSLLKDFDQYSGEVLKAARSDTARQYLNGQMTQLRGSLAQRAMRFEATAGIDYRSRQMGDAASQATIAVRSNPDLFEQQLAAHGAALDAAALPDEVRGKLWGDAKDGIASAAVLTLIDRDPRGTLKALASAPGASGNKAVEALSADGRERLRSAAESEIRRREMEARAAQADARDSLREAEADAFAAKASGIDATLPSRGQYLAAYGEEGAKRYEQASRMFGVYDTVAAAVAMPAEEGRRLIESYKPTQQEGAAAAVDVQSSAAKLYAQQRAALEKDPATGIMARDPNVKSLFEQVANGNAAAVPQYVAAVRSQAKAMGVAPRLLPEISADSLATALTFNPEKPGDRSENIQAMRQQWGRYFPQVMREIAPKLEADARIVAEMAPEDAKRFDGVLAQGRDKVYGLLDSKAKGDVQKASRDALLPLMETLVSNPDAEARFGEHLDAVQLMAASLVNRGMNPNEAASRAFDMVIGKRYAFRDSMRIPTGIDPDQVASRADRVRMTIKPSDLAVQPMRFSTEEQAQEALASRIRKEGAWFTTSDDAGVELRVPVEGRGLLPVVTKDGKRVRMTWAELAAAPTPLGDPERMVYGGGL